MGENKKCFEGIGIPAYFDLIRANKLKCFQDKVVTKTGLTDFHKNCITFRKIFANKNILFFTSIKLNLLQ